MPRIRTTTALAGALALLLTGVGAASPASAATTESILYGGVTVQRASLPARSVTIEVVSTLPADRLELSIDGKVVGQDTTITATGGRWVGSAPVDLSGRSGTVILRSKLFTGRYGLRVLDQFFQVVPDVAAPTYTPPTVVRPGPSTTGVPAGTVLVPSGPLTIRTPGAVVENLDVAGCVVVAASDVTIRRSRVRCPGGPGSMAVRVADGVKGLVVEDTEIDGLGRTEIGVGWTGYTLRRVNIHHVADGARFGHGVTVEGSWIHDMVQIGTLHADALQTTSASNSVIRGNLLDPRNAATGAQHNAAIMLGSETGTRAVRNVLIEGNVLGGGGYSLNVSGSITAEGVVIRGNVFDPTATHGPVIAPARVPLSTGNLLASGAPVPVKLAS